MSGIVGIPREAMWLPGMGVTGGDERACAKVVETYDADLILGQRKDTGEWIVYMRKGPNDGQPFPVLGLGQRLPSPDELQKKLYMSDVRRHGEKLYTQIYAKQQAALAETRNRASEANEVLADALAWGHRKMGAHPSPRIFVPRGVKT